jgi:hypothetical protein
MFYLEINQPQVISVALYVDLRKLSLNLLIIDSTIFKCLLMKKICRLLAITTVLMMSFNLYPQFCAAQIGDGDETDPDAPIDGGLSLLIAAGVGYGLKKANDQRKKSNTAELQKRDQ